MTETIKIGSIWTSANEERFVVTDVQRVNNDEWVFYSNVSSNKEYHCFRESFVSRFKENINER